MPVRAVLFDAGETLVHPSPSFPELFSRVLAARGHRRTPEGVIEASRAVFHRFSEAARDNDLWTTSPEASARFWKSVYERMLDELEVGEPVGLADALYETFTDRRNYALFDDVAPTLDALDAQGLALGVVSNFEAWLEDLLGSLGVRDRFGVVVISGVEGVEKPDEHIFTLALDRLGIGAEEVAYVGDNPEFDIAPARALGMTPVLIDRRERFPDADGIRITDLRALTSLLREVA
ncbi:MAG: HAD-IA family hydrolase [Actinomycetota bacterium]|nr:HAD-IA family hydrolase [Actinomycetota bacterium]